MSFNLNINIKNRRAECIGISPPVFLLRQCLSRLNPAKSGNRAASRFGRSFVRPNC